MSKYSQHNHFKADMSFAYREELLAKIDALAAENKRLLAAENKRLIAFKHYSQHLLWCKSHKIDWETGTNCLCNCGLSALKEQDNE